jgi:choline dehydrogenase-like flavoprotein
MSTSRIGRRTFLRRAVRAGAAVGVGSRLASLLGCADAVDEPTGSYDAIIVGGGTAGAIVAAKLHAAGGGRRRILVIEAGGPTVASIGGTDRPPWLPADRDDLTIFDVPGQYSQIAFQPAGAPYQLSETSFTYQGIGIGGNSAFNGMLFQTNPPAVFDARWPRGWQWSDVEPFFERVRQRVPVTNTPSTDGVAQNTGPASIIHPLYAANGWVEVGPGSPSHPHLDPDSLADVRTYVTDASPVDGVYFSRLTANHFGGTVPLGPGAGAVDTASLIVRGTSNVAVADASLIPSPVTGHPVATIMAIADRAGDILAARWS